MLDRIKNFFSVKGVKPSNSVLFWNAMYYVVLGVSALIHLDWFWVLYGISSFLAIGFIFDNNDSMDKNFWIMTTMPVLFILTVGGIVFIIIYPFYKLVNWINKLLDGETCLKHDDKRTSEIPEMVDDPNCASSYPVTYTCQKCGRVKETRSDLMLGMRIIEDDEI